MPSSFFGILPTRRSVNWRGKYELLLYPAGTGRYCSHQSDQEILSYGMKPVGTHDHKSGSPHWTFAIFRRPRSRGRATGRATAKAIHTCSNLYLHVSVADSLLHRPSASVPIPAGADSDLNSVYDRVAIWIGRANTVAGHFHLRDLCMGRDRIVEPSRHRWPAIC